MAVWLPIRCHSDYDTHKLKKKKRNLVGGLEHFYFSIYWEQ